MHHHSFFYTYRSISMDTLNKRKAMMSLRLRLASKRAASAPPTVLSAAPAAPPPTTPPARPKSSGCSSCGKKISLDPEDAEARAKERVRVARAKKGNYRSMGLSTMEPQHRR